MWTIVFNRLPQKSQCFCYCHLKQCQGVSRNNKYLLTLKKTIMNKLLISLLFFQSFLKTANIVIIEASYYCNCWGNMKYRGKNFMVLETTFHDTDITLDTTSPTIILGDPLSQTRYILQLLPWGRETVSQKFFLVSESC